MAGYRQCIQMVEMIVVLLGYCLFGLRLMDACLMRHVSVIIIVAALFWVLKRCYRWSSPIKMVVSRHTTTHWPVLTTENNAWTINKKQNV